MAGEYSPSEIETINSHLNKLAASSVFAQAGRLVRFLRYVVGESLENRGGQVNQYALAMELYNRDKRFDPATDSIVRVDAGRLRTKLREYYDTDGQADSVQFELPKGKYAVKIHVDSTISSNAPAASIDVAKNTENSSANIKQSLPGKFSIVVLPIEALSKDTQDEELADGITTEVINALGHAGGLDVISRRSAFAYKGLNKDAREVGQELNINYVVEGSLRKAGKRVRVAVALIDARSNHQVWAESYDYDMGDPLELEDKIGRTLATTLGSVLWRASMERTQRTPTDELDADSFIDLATAIFLNYSRRSFAEGKQLVQRAREKVPHLGNGDALLAFLLAHEVVNRWTDELEETHMNALAAADRAIDLGPGDTWVLGVTSEALVWLGKAQRAVTLSERAVAIAPDNLIEQARARLGHALLHVNQGREGVAHIERAFETSPGDHFTPPWHYLFRSWAYTNLEHYEDAAKAGQKAVEFHYGNAPCLLVYTNALAETGQLAEAQLALAELRRLSSKLTLEHLEWVYRMAFEPEEVAERYLCGLRKLDW